MGRLEVDDCANMLNVADVDEAVAAQQGQDGTGGRGANGHITRALNEARKEDAEGVT